MTINKPMRNIEILSPTRDHIIIKGDLTFSTINKASASALKFEQSAPTIN
ncbi:hypothetical protein BMETH_216511491263, partial [methanotrophic bacterial endosymbiont of Bathymodiolus sp.]